VSDRPTDAPNTAPDTAPDLPPSGVPVFQVTPGTNRHWLVLPETIRMIWIVSLVVLASTVAAEFAVDYHLKFHADEIPGFAAIFGFLACVVLVFGSKFLGIFLKRKDDYYDD